MPLFQLRVTEWLPAINSQTTTITFMEQLRLREPPSTNTQDNRRCRTANNGLEQVEVHGDNRESKKSGAKAEWEASVVSR